MKARLTSVAVEAIEPGPRDVFVWDTEIRGFGLKVTPRGARVYLLQYSRCNKARRVTIGRHGDGGLTTDQARREAEILRSLIRNGGDPAGVNRRQPGDGPAAPGPDASPLDPIIEALRCVSEKVLLLRRDYAMANGAARAPSVARPTSFPVQVDWAIACGLPGRPKAHSV